MRKLLFFFVSVSFISICFAQERQQFYTSRIEQYLDKEKALNDYYLINDSGIYIYAKASDSLFHREFGVEWTKLELVKNLLKYFSDDTLLSLIKRCENFKSLTLPEEKPTHYFETKKKLSGIKIALDPGHIAGDIKTAVLEKKSVQFTCNNQPIALAEGVLTLHTSLILKHLLEEQGAEVMLTRDKPNQTAFGITFKEWLNTAFKRSVDSSFSINDITEAEKNFLLTKATQREIFRTYFNNIDMRQRAKKINEFAPDLTLVIHYNVDEKNTGWQKPSTRNYNMVFTPGSFLKNELEKPSDRLAFFRLLLSDDIETSLTAGEYMINSFIENLRVPAASPQDADYLTTYCIPLRTQGIYARNLTLTRLIKGSVVYGETLYQDNEKECLLLSKTDTEVYGIKTSARVKQVAEAYFEGVMKYYGVAP